MGKIKNKLRLTTIINPINNKNQSLQLMSPRKEIEIVFSPIINILTSFSIHYLHKNYGGYHFIARIIFSVTSL